MRRSKKKRGWGEKIEDKEEVEDKGKVEDRRRKESEKKGQNQNVEKERRASKSGRKMNCGRSERRRQETGGSEIRENECSEGDTEGGGEVEGRQRDIRVGDMNLRNGRIGSGAER